MSDVFISREKAEGDLLAAAAFIGERIASADGRAEAMAAIVPQYLARGEVDLAAELANGVDDPFSRDKLLVAVAEKCADIDDDEYALQLTDSVEDIGMRNEAIERIALIKVEKGQIDKADEMATSLPHPEQVNAAIAVKTAVDGDLETAIADVAEIDFAASRTWALRKIAANCIANGDLDEAVRCLELSVTAADEIEHDEERIRTLCDIGNDLVEAKRNDLAVATFESARSQTEQLDNVHRDYFFANCSLGFLYANSEELADKTLDLIKDKTQMASALVGFARESWKKEDKETAVETLDEAFEILKSQRDIETRDTRAKNGLMAAIAVQYAGFGKNEKGVEAAQKVTEPNERANAISQIAQILAFQKEDDLARETLLLIEEPSERLDALLAISDLKIKADDTDAANSLVDEAAASVNDIPQMVSRSGVLNEITSRYLANGFEQKARETALHNLKAIATVKDESGQATLLVAVAGIFETANFELNADEKSVVSQMLRSSE